MSGKVKVEWWDWKVFQAAPEDMHEAATIRPTAIIERPCKNKWCGKLNDSGAKSCWHCELENPTS